MSVAHGTYAGLRKHRRLGQQPCLACLTNGRKEAAEQQRTYRGATVRTLKPCGTWAAYQRHRYRRESPCFMCRVAASAYEADRQHRKRHRKPAPKLVVCDDCGCLCLPREDCPMCLWITQQTREKAAQWRALER